MKSFAIATLAGIAGFIVASSISYFLIGKFSSNGHDKSVEASMTSIFIFGPVGFIVSFISGYIWAKNTFS